jgi:hypothetical protein
MRKIMASVVAMVLASSAKAAVVTYTLNLHEGTNGLTTCSNAFAVYATVSQGDNAGLFAYGVDLKGTGDAGGPTTMTLVNRTPTGTWDIDDTDPNYDGGVYPTKYGGFGTGRGASAVTGVVSGVQDLAKDTDLVRVYGFGQTSHKMDDFRPAPADGSLGPIPYKPYVGASNTDGGGTPYGNPPNPGGVLVLPAGSLRIATGTWTGAAPSIETLSVNTKASVWKLNHPNGTENEIATLAFAFRDIVPVVSMASLSGTPAYANQAVGGSIAVSGSNGSYVSEVDELLDPAVNKGSAPIQGIGDEAGNIYVMAKLNGTAAEIATLLSGGGGGGGCGGVPGSIVDATDPQFALLHAAYDTKFGGGGFNVLMKFPNTAGAKVFNWDFSGTSTPNITIDKLAAVPEPGVLCAAVCGAFLLASRRRANKQSARRDK